jgi:hypothetical protein
LGSRLILTSKQKDFKKNHGFRKCGIKLAWDPTFSRLLSFGEWSNIDYDNMESMGKKLSSIITPYT